MRARVCANAFARYLRVVCLQASSCDRMRARMQTRTYTHIAHTVFVDGHSSVHRVSVSSVLTVADSLTNPRSIFLFSGNSIPQPIAITRGIGYIDGIVVNAKLNPTDKSKAPLLFSLVSSCCDTECL